jgi:hypothetical protein
LVRNAVGTIGAFISPYNEDGSGNTGLSIGTRTVADGPT